MKREKGSFGALAYAAVEYADAKREWEKSASRSSALQRSRDDRRSKRFDRAVAKLKSAARAFS